jgi:hypothetical protein
MSRRGATNHVFTAADDAAMLDLRRQGHSFAAIALLLGLAKSSVGTRVRMLGGKLPPSKLQRAEERASARQEGGQVARKSDASGWCLCLGGCNKKFLSPDRLRIRICPTCKKRTAWQSGQVGEFHLSL